jgi:hypothetical protein
MKNSNDTIENRFRELPVCSAVPQPLRHRVPSVDSSTEYFVPRQQSKGNPLLRFRGNIQQFYICDSDTWFVSAKCKAFLCSQWLRERATMIRYGSWPDLFLYTTQAAQIQQLHSTCRPLNEVNAPEISCCPASVHSKVVEYEIYVTP